MATLNEIADLIATRVGRETDHIFKESVKFSIKNYRATFIRQDSERNGISSFYSIPIVVPTKRVDKIDNCALSFSDVDDNCYFIRTVNKIPAPIRLNQDVEFKFVGSPDGLIGYTYTELEEYYYTKYNKYTSNVLRYTFRNGYIYVFNAQRLRHIMIDTAFANVEEAINLCSSTNGCYTDDMEFPLPQDMITFIVKSILSEELVLMKQDDHIVETTEDKNAEVRQNTGRKN